MRRMSQSVGDVIDWNEYDIRSNAFTEPLKVLHQRPANHILRLRNDDKTKANLQAYAP